ncbi:hypothetical protein GCM10025782_18780 [Pedococcus ginsenosidimutans]|uniref:Uncharacterized protein n=1 Tax=Pedococcus ginsenosidimutans TaxID=490570 RepID=A0ABP8Y514_9MICO
MALPPPPPEDELLSEEEPLPPQAARVAMPRPATRAAPVRRMDRVGIAELPWSDTGIHGGAGLGRVKRRHPIDVKS